MRKRALEKTETSWMAEALTRLINFSVQKLKTIDQPQFVDAVTEFLHDDFFQYDTVCMYRYETGESQWLAVSRRNCGEQASVPPFPVLSVPWEGQVWTEDRYLYKLFQLEDEWHLLAVSLRESAASYSMYECSFFFLLVTLADSFYHMKRMSREMQEKVIEITNIRASTKIINGLKEERISLEDAIQELYELLSLDAVILAVPDEKGCFEVKLARGSSITTWDAFVEFLQSPETQSEYLELFSLVDSRQHNHGILSCRLSEHSPELYALQLRVLEHITSQITLVLSEKRMSKEALTDPLTGLYNRRHVEEVLKSRQSLFKSDSQFRLSVLMMDVDHFKQVNDTCGHKAGDRVLKAIAGIIKNAVRNVDIVGRYGGEEFIILIHSNFEIAKKAAERIRGSVEQTQIDIGSQSINVTISIGISEFTESDSPGQVVHRADENLYKAKYTGRNCVVY
jgi:diguanylate cyclase (GGDEF)-like protein